MLTTKRKACVLIALMMTVLQAQQVYDGYVLYSNNGGNSVYLVDQNKTIVHSWEHLTSGGYAVYLNEEGTILWPCQSSSNGISGAAAAGLLQAIDSAGNVVWEFDYKSNDYCAHHDIELMPNGNILLIAWEVKSGQEAMAAGFEDNSEVWPEHIIEIQPPQSEGEQAQIVWQWHMWDHLTTGNEPELFNVDLGQDDGWGGGWGGFGGGDWMHMNGISYYPQRDQIAFSSRYFNEIYVIDHSTTTQEAAGHSGGNSGMGGDILFRWGSPQNYGQGGTQWLETVHSPNWIQDDCPGGGNLLAYYNDASRVYELSPQMQGQYNYADGASLQPHWTYEGQDFSWGQGSCYRLPNGNTFICNPTDNYLFEVNQAGETVWEYSAGQGRVTRAVKYGADYPGIVKLLNLPTPVKKAQGAGMRPASDNRISVQGNSLVLKEGGTSATVEIFGLAGKRFVRKTVSGNDARVRLTNLPTGTYVVKVHGRHEVYQRLVHKNW
ncbi:MAG: aryl-sulfate sulfotransferase [Chitinivibrionales bacterium]